MSGVHEYVEAEVPYQPKAEILDTFYDIRIQVTFHRYIFLLVKFYEGGSSGIDAAFPDLIAI